MKVVVVENQEIYVMPDTVLLRNNDPYFLPDYATTMGEEIIEGVCVKITRIVKCIAQKFAHRTWSEYTVAKDHRIVGVQHTIGRCFDRSFEVGVQWNEKVELDAKMVEEVDEAIAISSKYIQLRIGDYVFIPSPIIEKL